MAGLTVVDAGDPATAVVLRRRRPAESAEMTSTGLFEERSHYVWTSIRSYTETPAG